MKSMSKRYRRPPASESAATVGWISTSDIMLFGFGLMCVAALGARSRSSSLEKESRAQVKQTEQLRQELDAQLVGADVLTGQLNERNDTLKKVKNQLSNEVIQLTKVEAQLTNAETQLTNLEAQLSNVKMQLTAETELNAKMRAAGSNLAKRLKSKSADYNRLQEESKVVQASFAELQTTQQQNEMAERRLRREILGLKGSLKRVAIVFDSSESMKEGNRWENAIEVVTNWLEHLDMEECVLIVFNDNVEVYPENYEPIKVKGEAALPNRAKLRAYLDQRKPIGRTNTLAALEAAYKVPGIDTIILFSDGAPYVGLGTGRFDAAMVKDIYTLCERNPSVPINTIGLGNYFSPEFSAFMLGLADKTGGTFLGR